MKKKLLKFLQYYKYPQYIFARNLASKINQNANPNIILDLPCGQGLTSLILHNITGKKILAADISSEAIHYANENFKNSNIDFIESDIHQIIENQKFIDCICIINSLFLLPDQDKLLKNIHKRLNSNGLFLLVVPNTQNSNFEKFQKIDPLLNTLIIHPQDFKTFFEKYNFKVISTQGCVYSSFWNRKIVKFFWIFGDLYLNFESFISKLVGNKPQYFVIVLMKNE